MTIYPPPAVPPCLQDDALTGEIFRVLLSALAEPGELLALPPATTNSPEDPAFVAALSLAHHETAVAVLGASGVLDASSADIVVCGTGTPPGVLATVRTGTPTAPEGAAKVFAGCARLDAPAEPPAVMDGLCLTLTGPGIQGERRLVVGGWTRENLEVRNVACGNPPTGFDLWLVDAAGRVCGIPRSTKVTVHESRTP